MGETGWADVTLPGFITAMFMFVILLCTLWFLLASSSLPLSVHRSASAVFSHCPFVFVISYFLLCGLSDGPSERSRWLLRLSALTLVICKFRLLDLLGLIATAVSGFSP